MSNQETKGKNLLYETRIEVLEMLEKRGFNVDTYKSFTKEEIFTQFEQNSKFLITEEIGPLDIYLSKENGESVFVKYRLESKFKKSKSLDLQIENIFNGKLKTNDTLIIIFVSRVLSNNKDSNVCQYCENIFKKKKYFVQIFGLENFLFNPTKNAIVPKHTKISQQEEAELLDRYNINNKKSLPIICREYPIAKYIGLKPGEICKIKALSLSSMYTIKYRLCVNNC